ncbi:cytochrome c biogenesis heme-transporting ATPase CcmA [Parapusillimonas sp. JC17]|uniref:cytochrome c biogenesis heme-transporting ATPase CcmA n=1 Tax=Parapusillimonas sp. JC17 TaxID=3445768 RepID=UPI003F9FB0F7
MLEGINLHAIRGERSLFKRLNFQIKAGECLLVQGENGSGKTSLLRMIAGLMPSSDGAVFWKGSPIAQLGDDFRRELLYCGHLLGLKNELNGIENLVASACVAGNSVSVPIAIEALRRSGLQGKEYLPVRFLSQGQKRRVSLARLLLQPRALWILDEPLAALDVGAVLWLTGVVDAHLELGGVVVMTSHQDLRLACMPQVIRIDI